MDIHTADLCDQFESELRICAPMFRSYGGRAAFGGQITTLKLFEDNGLVRKALEAPGNGRVLVVDGGGSMRRALVGDQIAALAVKNGWAGIVVLRLHPRLGGDRRDGHRCLRARHASAEDGQTQ
ncbi:MAG: ribonuclease E activity regulator RraA [Methyloversatilis sp.]|uniref:ribonuclease E activity regulator RraA n=1 Tax=Methyloversatilis sp. TaxID=2569862 RepID=UPI0025F1844C|nr:ribonuclease E activity regulator RraA [Methyloversatilis sp.]MCR6665938.1 ribonuclease E activity regulator RraA [Methyloversatilis sp.]